MFRLSREVRFSIDGVNDVPGDGKPTNSYAGYPTLSGLTPWFALRVTLAGEIDRRTSYLRNIQDIDAVVRQIAIPIVRRAVIERQPASLMPSLFDAMRSAWPGATLERLELMLSPLTAISIFAQEHPMIRLSQKFEFSASHRLHEAGLSDEENRAFFGKCNNPSGHGHNYELQVVVRRAEGDLSRLIDLERAVKPVVDRLDHRHLNEEIAEFRTLNPTVENIAKVIFGALKSQVADLAAVTVWETPKTWCEYSED
jgi:6-pyruvoyltetrahydropterin/6-carboxytetrahydropterin synthase